MTCPSNGVLTASQRCKTIPLPPNGTPNGGVISTSDQPAFEGCDDELVIRYLRRAFLEKENCLRGCEKSPSTAMECLLLPLTAFLLPSVFLEYRRSSEFRYRLKIGAPRPLKSFFHSLLGNQCGTEGSFRRRDRLRLRKSASHPVPTAPSAAADGSGMAMIFNSRSLK